MPEKISPKDLKVVLEKNFCTNHQLSPNITISNGTMTIACCCNAYHADCINVATEIAEILGFSDLAIE